MTGNRTRLDSQKGVFPLHYHPFSIFNELYKAVNR